MRRGKVTYRPATTAETPRPTYPEYDQVEALARQITPSFVDPANLHPEDPVMRRRGDDWCTAVIGRPMYPGVWMTIHEQWLLIAADRLGVTPPLPDYIVDARQEAAARQRDRQRRLDAARQRDRDAWTATIADCAVAGRLAVYDGTHARVRGDLHEPVGHVVPAVAVYSGTRTVRTHPAGRALCESPRRARPLRLIWQASPAGTPGTCDRCLRWIPKIRADA